MSLCKGLTWSGVGELFFFFILYWSFLVSTGRYYWVFSSFTGTIDDDLEFMS